MEDTKEIKIKIPNKLHDKAKEKSLNIDKIVQNAIENAILMENYVEQYKEISLNTSLDSINTDDVPPGSFIRIDNLDLNNYERIVDETKWDYINGILIHHSPESNVHNAIFVYLIHKISVLLDPKYYITRASRVALTIGKNKPEPDIMIFDRNDFRVIIREDGTKSDIIESAPLVVFEIVSKSSIEYDQMKSKLYLKKGIKEYWQIYPFGENIHINLMDLKGDIYEEKLYEKGEIRSRIIPDLAITIEELSDPDSNR